MLEPEEFKRHQCKGISFYRFGDESLPKLALLHGFLGSADDFLFLAQQLSSLRCVYVLDLPGAGLSKGPRALSLETFEDLSNLLASFLWAQSAEIWDIFGYSLGGRLALSIAFDTKLPLKTLILESAHPGLSTEEERASRLLWDRQNATRLQKGELLSFLNDWYDLPLFRSLKSHPKFADLLEKKVRNLRPPDMADLLLLSSPAKMKNYGPELSKRSLAISFVCGELDQKYLALSNDIERLLGPERVFRVAKAGHNVHFEAPEQLAQILPSILGHCR